MVPLVPEAYAAVNGQVLSGVIDPILKNIVTPIVEVMFAVAVLVFAYGVLQLVIHSEESEARENGKRSIGYGLIGLVIMMSAWGIIYLIANTVAQFK